MNNDQTVAPSEDLKDPGLTMNMSSEPWLA